MMDTKMKKLIALLLVFALASPLYGCGKSKTVKNAEELISAIGEVTLDSGEAVVAAQNAFDALSEKEKTQVENRALLEVSSALLAELEAKQKLEEQENAKLACAREAYEHICAAWEIARQFGDDMYNAWFGAIYEKEKIRNNCIQYFADKTQLSREEIHDALAWAFFAEETQDFYYGSWDELPETEKDHYRDMLDNYLKNQIPGQIHVAISMSHAYLANGKALTARDELEAAKQKMKELSELDSGYEHFPNLKGFYNTTSSFLDVCLKGGHSFEQYKVLQKDYEKEARDYLSDLEYVFE